MGYKEGIEENFCRLEQITDQNIQTYIKQPPLGLEEMAAQYRITKITHWAWSNVNFNGITYKNISCKDLGQSTLFKAINTLNKVQCQLVT